MSDMPEKIAVRKLDQYGSFYAYLHDTAFLEAGKSTPYIRADIADQLAEALDECSDALRGTEDWQHGMDRQFNAEKKAQYAIQTYRKAKGE